MSQLYILSVDINGKINIDTIQIIGPIIKELNNKTLKVYGVTPDYTFRYLKNNKLITLNHDKNFDEGWINLTDKYINLIEEETSIKNIEEDVSKIKEKYSKY